jgi:hypothetical protein
VSDDPYHYPAELLPLLIDTIPLKAKGLVAEVRQVVNVKDSFTRMQQERERERQERLREKRQAAEVAQQRRERREAIRRRLAGLAAVTDARLRGVTFEENPQRSVRSRRPVRAGSLHH